MVIWWIIALLEAALNRDKTTVKTGVVLGLGFGTGFMLSSLWTLGYGTAPGYIDWWKMWELNSGFYLGLLYAVILFLDMRNTDKTKRSEQAVE